LKVVSSGEGFAEICDFSSLSIEAGTEKSPVNYINVGDQGVVIPINTRVLGWENIPGCDQYVHNTLQVRYPDGTWREISTGTSDVGERIWLSKDNDFWNLHVNIDLDFFKETVQIDMKDRNS
jgi:hypothetical protein